jgi:hypothetical protein
MQLRCSPPLVIRVNNFKWVKNDILLKNKGYFVKIFERKGILLKKICEKRYFVKLPIYKSVGLGMKKYVYALIWHMRKAVACICYDN